MRPSSSHTSRVPPDNHQQDDTQPACQRRRLNNHADESDSDPESSASTTDGAISRKPSARFRILSPPTGASSQANSAALMTATSIDGPAASSSSRHAQPTHQSSHSQYDAQSDVEMTDSEVEESDTEYETGGAPLPLVAPARAHQIINTLPTPEPGSEYLSDSDEEDYDDGDDDDDNSQDDDSDDEMQLPQPHPNSLPPMAHFAPLPLFPHLGNAFFLQNSPPDVSVEHGQQPMPVQPMSFSMPAGPTDLANLPPLPQPPPNWVPLPAFITDQNLTISNAIPSILGSENLDLADFLRDWAFQGRYGRAGPSQPPALDGLLRQTQEQPDEIDFTQLKGDEYDFQGLNWTSMETTRKAARLRRQHTYRNYVNRMGSDKWMASTFRPFLIILF
ncbi:WD domain containing protein [Cordyceps fumosorosea ARSEF 2679]|uniref:WD domain containing protein n=1 Tax=Cordyceps fumosorosea (strain ARSEF 2679) TaxID=1081104 RepID=A0A162J7S7_CORFA|nr:WD domain containing protein [Cordyceps fumosorosea ARSEF 2679]OAA65002.1 WD domain containing protein [Cordyceps fumosorosea ARSEF 2679]